MWKRKENVLEKVIDQLLILPEPTKGINRWAKRIELHNSSMVELKTSCFHKAQSTLHDITASKNLVGMCLLIQKRYCTAWLGGRAKGKYCGPALNVIQIRKKVSKTSVRLSSASCGKLQSTDMFELPDCSVKPGRFRWQILRQFYSGLSALLSPFC